MLRYRHRPHLAYDDPRSQISQLHRALNLQSTRHRCRQRRNHRISRTRDVEDLTSPRRRMIYPCGPQHADSLLAHRHNQKLQIVFGKQLLPRGQNLLRVMRRNARRQ